MDTGSYGTGAWKVVVCVLVSLKSGETGQVGLPNECATFCGGPPFFKGSSPSCSAEHPGPHVTETDPTTAC